MIEKTVTVSGEDLRANLDQNVRDFLGAFSQPRDTLELEARVRLEPGVFPRIEVSCDLRVNGVARASGFMMPVLRGVPQHGLQYIAAGAYYAHDEEGPYPEELLMGDESTSAWNLTDDELTERLGTLPGQLKELRAVLPAERLAAARRMNPGQNAVWQGRVERAQTAAVLL